MAAISSARANLRLVTGEWEKLLQGEQSAGAGVRPVIYQSWQRSLSSGVVPGNDATPVIIDRSALEQRRRRQADLIAVARPIMMQARETLAETGTAMVLTDADGVVLCMHGDQATLEIGGEIGLVPGGSWGETTSGTNGIGTCLTLGRPIQVRAAEHFCSGIKAWTCSAAVIHDPVDGQILGVLDISGLDGDHNSHCLALAVAEAQRIELSLAQADAERRTRLLSVAFGDTSRWMDGGVVIFDHRGKVLHANRHAGRFLQDRGLPEDIWQSSTIRDAVIETKAAAVPTWLDRDWLERIDDRQGPLGTVLALPAAPLPKSVPAAPVAEPLRGIVGVSPAIVAAKARAQQLARLNAPILLLGPTGAGKEVFAQAIHQASPAGKKVFLPINCGALSRELLTSELFGYAEGAFTGARRGGMPGKFEAADGGTLFLDEIGEMPLDLQAHLLRVLEDGIVYRLGESQPRRVKVRVIAATHRDLKTEAAEGRFRLDLYYRLSVAQLKVPALRERPEDIPPLADHFMRQAERKHGLPRKTLDRGVMAALQGYDWPGNARELRNAVESMLVLSVGETVTLDDLPCELTASRPAYVAVGGGDLRDLAITAVRAAIQAESGNLTRAAARLGIAKSTLYEKMKRHGIDRAA